VRLIVRPRYVFVLNFENCAGVHLANLTLGHAAERGLCTCGVLGATNCANLTLSRCDLFGCGAEGLKLSKVCRFQFEESIIRDCTYGILSATGCQNLSFVHAQFRDNREFWGLRLSDTKNVGFTDCTIENNLVGPIALFEVTSCSDIWFRGGAIRQNSAPALTETVGKVAFSDLVIKDNSFDSKP
jgi:Right handed beta helix region